MRYPSLVFSILLAAVAGCLPVTNEEQPPFVDQLITGFESEPVSNPPRSIWRYNYQGREVFYVPPVCCDVPSDLYDSDGKLICSPDGGITGRGGGGCPDFFRMRTQESRVPRCCLFTASASLPPERQWATRCRESWPCSPRRSVSSTECDDIPGGGEQA